MITQNKKEIKHMFPEEFLKAVPVHWVKKKNNKIFTVFNLFYYTDSFVIKLNSKSINNFEGMIDLYAQFV